MLGGVAVAAHATPVAPAYRNLVTIQPEGKARGHRGHQIRVVTGALADLLLGGGIAPTMARKMVDRALATGPSALHTGVRSPLRPKPGDGVVGHRHPQRRIPALAQPRRQADMIGMHMCHQNAQHRQAVERVFEDFLPKRSEEHTSELQSLMRISYSVFCL